ncbi:hypothetical protein ERJ75_000625500 [Trypanosoma vivax]|nr:hypothetical protein ERJ75_000625500 [Trypanosoma vivax]
MSRRASTEACGPVARLRISVSCACAALLRHALRRCSSAVCSAVHRLLRLSWLIPCVARREPRIRCRLQPTRTARRDDSPDGLPGMFEHAALLVYGATRAGTLTGTLPPRQKEKLRQRVAVRAPQRWPDRSAILAVRSASAVAAWPARGSAEFQHVPARCAHRPRSPLSEEPEMRLSTRAQSQRKKNTVRDTHRRVSLAGVDTRGDCRKTSNEPTAGPGQRAARAATRTPRRRTHAWRAESAAPSRWRTDEQVRRGQALWQRGRDAWHHLNYPHNQLSRCLPRRRKETGRGAGVKGGETPAECSGTVEAIESRRRGTRSKAAGETAPRRRNSIKRRKRDAMPRGKSDPPRSPSMRSEEAMARRPTAPTQGQRRW